MKPNCCLILYLDEAAPIAPGKRLIGSDQARRTPDDFIGLIRSLIGMQIEAVRPNLLQAPPLPTALVLHSRAHRFATNLCIQPANLAGAAFSPIQVEADTDLGSIGE